jgi:hypothetical protein
MHQLIRRQSSTGCGRAHTFAIRAIKNVQPFVGAVDVKWSRRPQCGGICVLALAGRQPVGAGSKPAFAASDGRWNQSSQAMAA